MRFLRHSSTRLLTVCAAVLAVAAMATAIALASTGSAPPRKPLSQAIHQALTAPAPAGVTARIQFTNQLLSQSNLGQADPLLSGATGRLWASKDGKLRIELQSNRGSGDSQVLVDNDRVTVYDAAMNTAYRMQLPAGSGDATHKRTGTASGIPSVAQIQRAITSAMQGVGVAGPQPGTVAGQGAYTVRITPKRDGGLLGGAELAWDAANGVPLRVSVFATGSPSPVLELKATDISFGPVSASTFAVSPPSGAKVVDVTPPAGGQSRGAHKGAKAVEGLAAVRRQVPFTLSAPATLAAMPRTGARLISVDGRSAALVTYGHGPGGIAVIESKASSTGKPPTPGRGLNLPTVAINGATGRELPTALGTAVAFQRNGIDYAVVGSVRPATAAAAARGL
jgi:outer membrane lipoprotein-sorting protein